jgi:hypothetical protein
MVRVLVDLRRGMTSFRTYAGRTSKDGGEKLAENLKIEGKGHRPNPKLLRVSKINPTLCYNHPNQIGHNN